MGSFEFRLQSVLRVREAERDEKRSQLAEAYHVEQVLKGQASQLSDELADVQQEIRNRSKPGQIDVDHLLASHRHAIAVRAQQAQLAAQMEQVQTEIQRRRTLLVEADKQVRVLEKLRQRRLQQHRQGQQQAEIKTLDEISAQRYESQRADQ